MIGNRILATLLTAAITLTATPSLRAADPSPPSPLALLPRGAPAPTTQVAPSRITYINGDVSFSRPGAAEGTPVKVNTPLAKGMLFRAVATAAW
jgi:hypothetical protein